MSIWDSNYMRFKAQQARSEADKMLYNAQLAKSEQSKMLYNAQAIEREEREKEKIRIQDNALLEARIAAQKMKNCNVRPKEFDYAKELLRQQAKNAARTDWMQKMDAIRKEHEKNSYLTQYDFYKKLDAAREEYEKKLKQIDIE